MGWRKTLVEAVKTKLLTLSGIRTVQIWNKELEAGFAAGKIPIAPCAIVQYRGFEALPETDWRKRRLHFGILFGLRGQRGEMAALKGDSAPAADYTFDEVLEAFENAFWHVVLVANMSPCIVGDEEYIGSMGGCEWWGCEIIMHVTLKFS
jgi:hypothetical protein